MKQRIREFLSFLPPYILTMLTVLLILWLTLSPRPFGSLSTPFFPGADKLAHAVMFGFLVAMAALDRSRKENYRPLSPRYLLSAALLTAMFGISIEYLQEALHTGRSFEYADMIADSAGAFCAALLWMLIQLKTEG